MNIDILKQLLVDNYMIDYVEMIKPIEPKTINELFLAKTNIGKVVIKIFNSDNELQIINSIEVQAYVSQYMLAPRVLINKDGKKWIKEGGEYCFVQEYIEDCDDINAHKICACVAKIKELHKVLERICNIDITEKWVEKSYNVIRQEISSSRLTFENFRANVKEAYEQLVNFRKVILEEYKLGYFPTVKKAIHADLRPSNVCTRGSEYLFIDFDFITIGDFYYDIGSAAMHFGEYSVTQFEKFIELYDKNLNAKDVLKDLMSYYVQSSFPIKLYNQIEDSVLLNMIEERKRNLIFCDKCMKKWR